MDSLLLTNCREGRVNVEFNFHEHPVVDATQVAIYFPKNVPKSVFIATTERLHEALLKLLFMQLEQVTVSVFRNTDVHTAQYYGRTYKAAKVKLQDLVFKPVESGLYTMYLANSDGGVLLNERFVKTLCNVAQLYESESYSKHLTGSQPNVQYIPKEG